MYGRQVINQHVLLQDKQAYWLQQKTYLAERQNDLDSKDMTMFAAFVVGTTKAPLKVSEAAAKGWLMTNGQNMLTNCGEISNENAIDALLSQFHAFCSKKGRWSLSVGEYANGKGTALRDAGMYMRDRKDYAECRQLAVVCLAVLSVAPSEASVERLFSTLKYTWTPRRNKTHMGTVNSLLMIKCNARLCERSGVSANDDEAVPSKHSVLRVCDDGEGSDDEEMKADS